MNQVASPHLFKRMKSKKTGKAKDLDQFYTNPKVAKHCIDLLKTKLSKESLTYFLEPSAGTGSFSSQLENCMSIDLDPKFVGSIKADFLKLSKEDILKDINSNSVCVIGNPPFGKNSSLAVKFFNHSTKFGDVIAFIIPKTFRKDSVLNRLNLDFSLIEDQDLPKDSFIYEENEYDIPSCFQIWVRSSQRRQKVKFVESPHFDFVKKNNCDFAVRRAGGTAGKAQLDYSDCKIPSFHFLKIKTNKFTAQELIDLINSIDFSKQVNSTAGVRSLSKGELVKALQKKIDSLP